MSWAIFLISIPSKLIQIRAGVSLCIQSFPIALVFIFINRSTSFRRYTPHPFPWLDSCDARQPKHDIRTSYKPGGSAAHLFSSSSTYIAHRSGPIPLIPSSPVVPPLFKPPTTSSIPRRTSFTFPSRHRRCASDSVQRRAS